MFFIHGMGGSPADWSAVIPYCPGTPLRVGAGAGSPETAARELAKEILVRAEDSFALCGYSMGARLAILTAEELLTAGGRLDSLVLISSGLGCSSESERASREQKDAAWERLAETSLDDFWRLWYQQALFKSLERLTSHRRLEWDSSRKHLNFSTLSTHLRALSPARHPYLLPRLENLARKGLRMLYIAGELDEKYMELAQTVGKIPGISVKVIANAGHILPLEAPEALAKEILSFIQ